MSFMDDFDSVMNKVMEELEKDTDTNSESADSSAIDFSSSEISQIADVSENADISSDPFDASHDSDKIFGKVEEFSTRNIGKIVENDFQKDTDELFENTKVEELKMESVAASGLKTEKTEEFDISVEELMDAPFEPAPIKDVDALELDASNVASINKNTGNGSFSIDLEGIIGVDIRLRFGEKEFFLTCDDEHLIVKLGDGTSFTIPLKNLNKKAA